MPKFSIAAAHRITGVSRTTIQKHIKNSTLSWELAPNGKSKLIDAAELERVYGGKGRKFDWEEGANPSSKPEAAPTAGKTGQSVQVEVNSLREQLQKEIDERAREREQFRQQIDNLQDTLKMAMDGHERATKLLEDRSSDDADWKTESHNLQELILSQKAEFKKEILQFREDAKREAMAEIKDKYWWQVVFGS